MKSKLLFLHLVTSENSPQTYCLESAHTASGLTKGMEPHVASRCEPERGPVMHSPVFAYCPELG